MRCVKSDDRAKNNLFFEGNGGEGTSERDEINVYVNSLHIELHKMLRMTQNLLQS